MQGFLVSLLFLILRKPLFAGIVSGFAVALLSQVQTILTKVIIYGGNFLELLIQVIKKAETLLHLSSGSGWYALGVYFLIIGTIGGLGGGLGWHLGRLALRIREGESLDAI